MRPPFGVKMDGVDSLLIHRFGCTFGTKKGDPADKRNRPLRTTADMLSGSSFETKIDFGLKTTTS